MLKHKGMGFFLTHSIIKKIKVIETKIFKHNDGLK
jgi:hypothetical protein